jgi:hypothetical protein
VTNTSDLPWRDIIASKMVCSKCQKKLKSTELATPGVKRKNEMYYGSPSTTLGGGDSKKATLGNTGVGKVCSLVIFPALFEFYSFSVCFLLVGAELTMI